MKEELKRDIFSSLTNFGAISIMSQVTKTSTTKTMQATAIVEWHHIKTLSYNNDPNDSEDVNCAAIHYIAGTPFHLGIVSNHWVKALLGEIVSRLLNTKPKIKRLYVVTDAKFFEVMEEEEEVFINFGFEKTDLVTFDGKTVEYADIDDEFINKVCISSEFRTALKHHSFVKWIPDDFNYILVKRYKDDIGVSTYHQILGTRYINDYESKISSTKLINFIKDAIKKIEEGHDEPIKIMNNRAGALSNQTVTRSCAWEACIELVEPYDIKRAQLMRNGLNFMKEKYYDLLIFSNDVNSLHALLHGFSIELFKPLITGGQTQTKQRVPKKDYKNHVMNAEDGLFICLLKNSNHSMTHAIGINAYHREVYDPSTSQKTMKLNEQTLTKCCNDLDCIAFEVVGQLKIKKFE